MDYDKHKEYIEHLETVNYKVYKITCLINNKVYIGITKQTIGERFSKHVSESTHRCKNHFHKALKKYGKDAFSIEEIDTCIGFSNACELEIKYIEQHDSFNNGYNKTLGGQGVPGVRWKDNPIRQQRHKEIMSNYVKPIGAVTEVDTRQKQSEIKLAKISNPVVVLGIEYNSIRAAARAHNTTFYHIKKYLETGCELKQAKKSDNVKEYYVDDVVFWNREQAAKFFGTTIHNLSATIKRYRKSGLLDKLLKDFTYEYDNMFDLIKSWYELEGS